jgi:purine-nucleoside phosphorylase
MVTNANEMQKIHEAVRFLEKEGISKASLGVILGSGLGDFISRLDSKRQELSYADIPHFAASSVIGHAGKLVWGELAGIPLIVMAGRVHFYEGHSMAEVAFPTRVLIRLGVRHLIVTNAAGGINRSFRPGDLMLISDHINLLGGNPLIGPNLEEFGPRFPDMSEAYSRRLRNLARAAAADLHLPLREGVYVATPGPSYETPAEIEMFRRMGADAVGMSTVPEVIAAHHAGLEILGVSCITNMAAGVLPCKLLHEEVLATTARVQQGFCELLTTTIGLLSRKE